MKTKLILLVALLCSCRSIELTKVQQIGAGTSDERAFYYYLPKADLLVQAEVTRTTKTPGEFKKYVCLIERFLTAEQREEIVKDTVRKFSAGAMTCKLVPRMDPEHIYRIKLPKCFLKRNDLTMEYLPSGELKGGKGSSEDLTAKVVVQTVSSLASVAGALAGRLPGALPVAPPCDDGTASYKLAVERGDMIEKLLAARHALVIGMEPYEQASSLTAKLEQMDKQLLALFGQFMGTTEKKTIVLPFLLDPSSWKDGETVELFKLSKTVGIERTAQGDVVWEDDFDAKKTLEKPEAVCLTWKAQTGTSTSYAGATNTAEVINARLVYRIPMQGRVLLKQGTVLRATQNIAIPQLGGLGYIPDLKSLEFTLFEGLGALATVTGSTKTIDPSIIDAAGKAFVHADTLLRAKDPLDVEIEDLEKQVKRKELIDKLSGVAEQEEEEGDE